MRSEQIQEMTELAFAIEGAARALRALDAEQIAALLRIIAAIAAEPGVAVPEPDEQQREVIACKHCDRIIPGDDCCMAGPAASPVAQEDQP